MQPVTPSSTDVSVTFRVLDSTTFLPYESLTSATSGLALWYRKGALGAVTAITEADHTNLTDAHSDGKLRHADDGWYRLDLPDAAVPTAEHEVTTFGGTATGYVILGGALVGKPVEVVSASLVTAIWAAVTDSSGVTTLLSRLSSARAGYLDNLSAGAVALQSTLSTLSTTVSGLVAAVWAYATRTLTSSAAATAAAVAGSSITATRGDTLSVALTGLGSITGRTKLWFTVKARPATDADTASKVQITESGGLLYLNGAAATSGQGSIVVDSAASGNITITVAAVATAQLAVGAAWSYDVQWADATGLIHTLTSGSFMAVEDVTRATS